tara:strand:- start:562 stop:1506 length:945 start_codon:yes stop_codon:yes gene_type:complete
MKKLYLKLIIFFSFFVLLFLCEIYLRFYVGLGDPILYKTSNVYGYSIKPNQDVQRRGNSIIINNLGLRDIKKNVEIENCKKKIFFLGDSLTYGGSKIETNELFSFLIGKYLNYDCIFVVAVNGWGMQNIEKFMKAKNLFYKGDYVILLIEENFTRGLRRIHSYSSMTQKKHFFALYELTNYYMKSLLFKIENADSLNEEKKENLISINFAIESLQSLIERIENRQGKIFIAISPSKTILKNIKEENLKSDTYYYYDYLLKKLEEKKINTNYLANDLKKFSSSKIDTLFLDEIHYSKKGHSYLSNYLIEKIAKNE